MVKYASAAPMAASWVRAPEVGDPAEQGMVGFLFDKLHHEKFFYLGVILYDVVVSRVIPKGSRGTTNGIRET